MGNPQALLPWPERTVAAPARRPRYLASLNPEPQGGICETQL
ncbi:hypothetical protein SAMN06295900_10228 [Trinickia caryophylli]|uniref:Uncharacterized protein n=1 Tax=Trinickia caryophylli TaxID=28094 RepID=A0A1X7CUR3_TRICW|nr:hypothetical protein SAMN06295900_10228 [Trinickia caryophylli]